MPSSPTDAIQTRVDELVLRAKSLASSANFGDALHALQEASSLSPGDHHVEQALTLLQQESQLDTPLWLVCRYVRDGDEAVARQALEALARAEQSPDDARKTLDVALEAPAERPAKDRIIGVLFAKPNSRKALTSDIHDRPTQIFQASWASGDESMKGMINTLLAPAAWASEADRVQAEKDVFTLLMAKVLEPGLTNEELAMKSIARLLAVDAKTLKDLMEPESFEMILGFLSIESGTGLRSQSTLAAAKFLEASPDLGQRLLTEYVVSRLTKQNTDDRILAFSAAGAIFPVVPAMASKLFLTEGFLSDLIRIGQGKKSATLRRSVLELLSAACVEKGCREAIKENCEPWLRDLVAEGNDDTCSRAALVLAKVTSGMHQKDSSGATGSPDNLVKTFKNMVLTSTPTVSESAIEGLAFRSTDSQVKEELASDSAFLKRLLEVLMNAEVAGTMALGGLTIISNLTQYPPVMSSEQKRIAQLKAYANQSKPPPPDTAKEDARITERCSKVLDAGVGSVLVKFTRTATATLLTLITSIIASLAKHPKHRGKMAQQGLFDVALRISESNQIEQNAPQVKRDACLALAQMLIRLNPTLLFQKASGGRSIPAALNALHWLLAPVDLGENDTMGKTVNYFPVCEALKAITNMAAMVQETGDDTAIRIILGQSWDMVEGYMESEILQVRQAAIECLCNLCISEDTTKLYTDDPKAEDRFAILLRQGMFDEEKGVRLAAGGALATILGANGVPVLVKIKGAVPLLGKLVLIAKEEWVEERRVDEASRVLACLQTVLSDDAHGEQARKELRAWSGCSEGAGLVKALKSDFQGSPVADQASECSGLLQ